MNSASPSPPPLPTISPGRVWPYVVWFAAGFAALAWFISYYLWNAPTPASVSDESSFMGEMIVKIVMVFLVGCCAGVGALLGRLVAYLIHGRK